MVFWIKKAVAPLLFPVPVMLFLLALGVGFLWWGDRKRLGKVLVSLAFALLFLFSFGPFAELFILAFEADQQPFAGAAYTGVPVEWVVVLGGGVVDDPRLPPNAQLSLPSLARVVEGVRILREFPDARLIVSGGVIFNAASEAYIMGQTARMLGVDSTRIVLEEASLDTKDEAVNLAEMLQGAPFVMVTSASHMPRALALFRKQGLDPIPAPTDFAVRRSSRGRRPTRFYPTAGSLHVSSQAWYELLGNLWVRLRGQV